MKGLLLIGARLSLFFSFVVLCFTLFDWHNVKGKLIELFSHPITLIMMSLLYGLAFLLRAGAWKLYVNKKVPFSIYLYALFYSLFINHVMPLKVGDAVRIGFLAKEKQVHWDEAVHSVLVMRLLDYLVLGFFAGAGSLWLGINTSWNVMFWILFAGGFFIIVLYVLGIRRNKGFFEKHFQILKEAFSGKKGWVISLSVAVSWVAESFVVIGVTQALLIKLVFFEGLWVNSITIAGQLFHFTPGGVGTYESVMAFSLVMAGVSWEDAYTTALLTHGFKFVFSYAVGLWAWLAAPIQWAEISRWMKGKVRDRENE
jgi:hypothetical protein